MKAVYICKVLPKWGCLRTFWGRKLNFSFKKFCQVGRSLAEEQFNKLLSEKLNNSSPFENTNTSTTSYNSFHRISSCFVDTLSKTSKLWSLLTSHRVQTIAVYHRSLQTREKEEDTYIQENSLSIFNTDHLQSWEKHFHQRRVPCKQRSRHKILGRIQICITKPW